MPTFPSFSFNANIYLFSQDAIKLLSNQDILEVNNLQLKYKKYFSIKYSSVSGSSFLM